MDDFSFSFSHFDILFLLVKSLMKFDTFDGDCSLTLVYVKSMKSDTLDSVHCLTPFYLSQDPVYSKKLQSQPITFPHHHPNIYLYFYLSVFSVSPISRFLFF